MSLIKGIKVLESFTPTEQGAAKPGKTNRIVPVPNQQAAVTFGAGMSTQQLHNGVYGSKLFTIGAAHGKSRFENFSSLSNNANNHGRVGFGRWRMGSVGRPWTAYT